MGGSRWRVPNLASRGAAWLGRVLAICYRELPPRKLRDLTNMTERTPVERSRRVLATIPYLLVAGVVAFNLVNLRAQSTPVAYLNDAAMHSEMVRFATAQLRAGHLPLTAWFPFLGEGSPHFLHYQSLGAMLTGAIGLAVGPDHAFSWVSYLVLASWPVSVFCGARLAGFDPFESSLAAVVSPLVFSVTGIGYEQRTYLWTGYGLWAQELAMWTLPLAWGYSFRAVRTRRALAPAAVCCALTIAFHFLTGYLAIWGMVTALLTADNPWRARLRHFGELVAATALLSAWVIVPLLWFRNYASINEFLQHGPDVNSYGARQSLEWLFTGQLFDEARAVVLTPLVLGGLELALWRWRRSSACRNLIVLFGTSLLLFFGRTTFGRLMVIVPGNADLFYRRFLMGVQLTGIFAAGIAIRALGAAAFRLAFGASRTTSAPSRGSAIGAALPSSIASVELAPFALGPAPSSFAASTLGATKGTIEQGIVAEVAPPSAFGAARAELALKPSTKLTAAVIGLLLVVAYLFPAYSQISTIAAENAGFIATQQRADLVQGREIAPLIALVKREGGRVYAGLPVDSSLVGGWGSSLTVGDVPVYKYLAWENVDEVGFTLRTASLMTDPEVYFDENIPADFPLFGVRWLIYPIGKQPPPAATRVMVRGPYVLWRLATSGYLQVVDTVGSISANRKNVGRVTGGFVRSDQALAGRFLTVGWNGRPAPAPTAEGAVPRGAAGQVLDSSVQLAALGEASATIVAHRTAVVLLKASYSPDWKVTVDGRPALTEMISPAYVGVAVPPGRHVVKFTYERWPAEGPLLALAGAALVALLVVHVLVRRKTAASVREPS